MTFMGINVGVVWGAYAIFAIMARYQAIIDAWVRYDCSCFIAEYLL